MLCHTSLCLLVLGVVSSPSLSAAHPCDTAAPNTLVCDPSTGGSGYFQCMADGVVHTFSCGTPLVFNNAIQSCDWPANSECVSDSDPAGPGDPRETTATAAAASTTTTTTTTTSTATTTTPRPNSGVITTTTPASYPAGTCNPSTCQLPHCRCVGTDIPGKLQVADVPQMVMLTFDDAVNTNNFNYYQRLFPAKESDAVKNPNGCRTAATFFVDGTWTDSTMVKTLSDLGSEMASHSLTHSAPSTWNAQAWDREMQGMREVLANDTGLPLDKVVGMRAPFLQLGGETQFTMLENRDFLYDSSMYGGSLKEDTSPPLWPFTLAYPPKASQLVCDQPNCPARSYPDVWEVPIVRQYNLGGQPCSMTDSCVLGSAPTKDDVKDFLRHNFDRHFKRNRAPFMISLHATWFSRVSSSFEGLKEFLEEISLKPEVWQVTLTQMLDWVRHPLPLSRVKEIPSWQCSQSSQTPSSA